MSDKPQQIVTGTGHLVVKLEPVQPEVPQPNEEK